MDIEVRPCAAGSEAMRMKSMTMRAQVMGYEDHGNREEGRESRYDRGSLHSHLQRSIEKTINANKSKGMGSHLCPCHSERMMPLPLVQSHLPVFQGTDGTLSWERVGMTLLQNQPFGHHSHCLISHESTLIIDQLCPLSEMPQAICHE